MAPCCDQLPCLPEMQLQHVSPACARFHASLPLYPNARPPPCNPPPQATSSQRVFYEYVMLSGVNDGEEQAHQLGQLLQVGAGGKGPQAVGTRQRRWCCRLRGRRGTGCVGYLPGFGLGRLPQAE